MSSDHIRLCICTFQPLSIALFHSPGTVSKTVWPNFEDLLLQPSQSQGRTPESKKGEKPWFKALEGGNLHGPHFEGIMGGSTLVHCPGWSLPEPALFATENQEQYLFFLYRLYNSQSRKQSLIFSKNKVFISHPGVCIMTCPHTIARHCLSHTPNYLSTCLPVSSSGTGGIPNKLPPWIYLLLVVEFPPTKAPLCYP